MHILVSYMLSVASPLWPDDFKAYAETMPEYAGLFTTYHQLKEESALGSVILSADIIDSVDVLTGSTSPPEVAASPNALKKVKSD